MENESTKALTMHLKWLIVFEAKEMTKGSEGGESRRQNEAQRHTKTGNGQRIDNDEKTRMLSNYMQRLFSAGRATRHEYCVRRVAFTVFFVF